MQKNYNRFGQFTYFDRREAEDVEIKEEIYESNKRAISMAAIIYGKVNTSRQIVVYDNGMIREFEGVSESSLGRCRTIYSDGTCQISYMNKETQLNYGPCKSYQADGGVFKGELYEGKRYGYSEEFYAYDDCYIGERFDGNAIGEWKIVKKDGTKETVYYDG